MIIGIKREYLEEIGFTWIYLRYKITLIETSIKRLERKLNIYAQKTLMPHLRIRWWIP